MIGTSAADLSEDTTRTNRNEQVNETASVIEKHQLSLFACFIFSHSSF